MQNLINPKLTELFIKKCKEHNLKVTPQRIAIFQAVVQSQSHPAADDIFRIVKKQFPMISFDTVNRTMLTFSEIDILNIIESYSGARRFDPNLEDHHHLHCIRCGKIIDFYSDYYNQIKLPEKIDPDFKVLHKKVVLTGICKDCQ